MNLELRSLLDYGIPESLEILNLGFSDYFVPIQMDLAHFYDLLRTNHVDLNLSQIVLNDNEAIGVALIARRGWSSRLAGMSIVPDHRGKGVGRYLLKQIVEKAKARGDRCLELEVIEQNEPAVELYRKSGFQILRRLLSYRLENPSGFKASPVEIDIRELADLVNLSGLPNLPWQLSSENLSVMGPPHQAFKLASSYVAITDPSGESVVLRSLLTLPESRKKGQASRLLKALFAQYRGKTWVVPAIFPEEIGGFFDALGFERQKLSQFHMELPLV